MSIITILLNYCGINHNVTHITFRSQYDNKPREQRRRLPPTRQDFHRLESPVCRCPGIGISLQSWRRPYLEKEAFALCSRLDGCAGMGRESGRQPKGGQLEVLRRIRGA